MQNYTFSTQWLDYTFKADGELVEFKERETGINLAQPGCYAFYLLPGVEARPYPAAVLPQKVEVSGNEVSVEFAKVRFRVLIQSFADHLRFCVIDQQPLDLDYGRFVFAAGLLQDQAGSSFSGSAISLHINCNLFELPGRSEQLGAMAYAKLGAVGVSAALAGASFASLRDVLKNCIAHLTIDDIPLSPYGGPYGAEAPGSRDDYLLAVSKPDISDDRWIEPVLRAGASQVDFHHGPLYRHGDYLFDPELFPNGALDFRARVTDPLHERGCLAGLHSYTGMVDVKSSFVSPVPDADLYGIAEYTLAADLDEHSTALLIEENAADVPLYQTSYTRREMTCLLIDHEIIFFSGTDGEHSLTGCQRGYLGTSAHKHKKGAKLRHLSSMYNLFQCIPGSALFYILAKNKARTYNEAGFDTLYFDGLECIGACCTGELEGLGWHYEAVFVRETLRHCVRTPIVEYSTLHPLLWTARSLAGAFDYPTSAYKPFIDLHCADNEARAHRRLLPSQLGWLHLHPPSNSYQEIAVNWGRKYIYSDDVDYIGSKAVAYGSGLSYYLSSPELLAEYPTLAEHFDQIRSYARLRSENYFSPEIRQRLKAPAQGWHLIEKDGLYGFEQLTRLFAQPYQLDEADNVQVDNPYPAQKPLIRIEAQSAAAADNPVVIWEFDQDKPLELPFVEEYPEFLDIKGKEALVLTLSSDGTAGKLNLRLEARRPRSDGFGDHVIDLGFSGTRSFMLCEHDNGDWEQLDWAGDHLEKNQEYYSRYRNPLSYDGIGSIRVLRSGGGELVLHSLKAHAVDSSPISSPSVTISGKTVSFDIALEPGMYLEYSPGAKTALVYDVHGLKQEVAVQGSVGILPQGSSKLTMAGSAYGNRRLKLHLLVKGEQIFN